MSADESQARSRIEMLRTLTHAEFRAGLVAAQRRRDESAEIFAEYVKWFTRLEPYLARDPGLTVDQALQRYGTDLNGSTERR